MPEISKSNEDIQKHIREQIAFLKSSANAYDNGFRGEAKRLAVTIRILVHNTKKSQSLLTQLQLKHLLFFDTAVAYNPNNYFSYCGLAIVTISPTEGGEFIPLCLAPPGMPGVSSPKQIQFDSWWNAKVIVDQTRKEYTRRDLVLTVCDREGGAHVDPKLDAAYLALTRDNTMGYRYNIGHSDENVLGVELASVRQIAYEVLLTLKTECPQFF
jgi:hypothetical protein